ncbi:MAG: imidazole glycerol phosphate synthase subunit HisH, partial [Chloroflexota bacterium]
ICLGMQLLFESSQELGSHTGLGFLKGTVRQFESGALKVPHTGWNQVEKAKDTPLLEGIPTGSYAYFNHGYFCEPAYAEDVQASTSYGVHYACVVGRGRLYGVQFHPEKSQAVGLQVLRNFVERC